MRIAPRCSCSPPRLLHVVLVVLIYCQLLGWVSAGENNHRYKDSEQVILWVNKVGPYNNPQVRRALEQHPCCAAGAQAAGLPVRWGQLVWAAPCSLASCRC